MGIWHIWMNGLWHCRHMHPYERLFAALREKREGWYLNDSGELRRAQSCPISIAAGVFDPESDYADDDAKCCFGMTDEQMCYVMLAADGCDYEGSGYEDLARKLRHYLGVKQG